MNIKMLDGNSAAVEAIRLAQVKFIAAYPITPISAVAEKLSELVEDGSIKGKYLRVESEHSALSSVIGAQLTGVRAVTATSSVGLALMHEVMGVASGLRVPIVMPIANRALVSPWSLWCDHQDSMSERESGWMQFYAENVQEVLDLMLVSYKIAEDPEVQLPAMVCFDGFYLSHSLERVNVPNDEDIIDFIGDYDAINMKLSTKKPMFINNLTPPSEFSEMRYQQMIGFKNSLDVIESSFEKYNALFKSNLSMVESYKCDDAEIVIVALGSTCGTAKHVANQFRSKGIKAGVLKITSYRPFPYVKIEEILKNVEVIGVIDRSAGLGAKGGALFLDILTAMDNYNKKIFNYIAGLGGRDISEETISKIFNELFMNVNSSHLKQETVWIDTDENAMEMRKVKC